MPHMLMMIEPLGQRATRNEAQGRAAYDAMVRWGESLTKRGLLIAAESLVGTDKAVRLSRSAGAANDSAAADTGSTSAKTRTLITDGPFAEAKEMVGGFFLIKTESREEAIAIAQECPALEWLTVEVRAVAPCFA